ncbi:MAG: hypothetical protein WBV85_07630 [Solirubrobacteraceae bacterium]
MFLKVARTPWGIALAIATPLAIAYLILAPPAGDLAAATYRSDLFARVGFTTWDTGWYAAHGHWLPAYSLLSPALGALLGVRLLLALSAIAASILFALIAERMFETGAARVAAGWFALGVCVSLLSGRVPYELGFAIGLGAVLAAISGRWAWALALAVLTSAASPVAGAFLALAGVAGGLGVVFSQKGCLARARGLITRSSPFKKAARARESPPNANNNTRAYALLCVALTGAATAPILILSLAYPEGGYEPFAASAFWPALVGVALIALLLPQGPLTARGRMTVRVGAALYALALIAAYAIHTPMGGNAARLGPLLAGPLLAGVLWEKRRTTLLVLAPLLLYWQLATPIRDYASLSGDPSVKASYYAPVLGELRQLTRGKPTIVEVPLTKAHWEAAYLAGHDGIKLARGWERQLDTRYAAIFYGSTLSAAPYRAWLAENRVQYVALPNAPLDKAGALEGALIAHGLPYLRELWHSKHWRVYRVIG